jgi:hypothetical protein
MDALFGGGLPVGTVLLIEDYAEHTPNTHLLLKLFLAEGVMCGHSLFLASASEDPAELLKVFHTNSGLPSFIICGAEFSRISCSKSDFLSRS